MAHGLCACYSFGWALAIHKILKSQPKACEIQIEPAQPLSGDSVLLQDSCRVQRSELRSTVHTHQ